MFHLAPLRGVHLLTPAADQNDKAGILRRFSGGLYGKECQKAGQEHADAATGPDADWQLTRAGDGTPPGPPPEYPFCRRAPAATRDRKASQIGGSVRAAVQPIGNALQQPSNSPA